MLKHHRGAVTAVMNMSLFVLLLLSGLLCSTSGLQRKYYYINKSTTWTEAQSYCRERYTDLATVDSMDDVNTMINLVNDGYNGSVWIGLQKAAQNRWVWSNGEDTISQYSPWATGEPTGEDCGFFSNNAWSDHFCWAQLHFVCYNESTGYIMVNNYKTWIDAQSYCRQYYTDLATVQIPDEQKRVGAVVGEGTSWFWIGLFLDYWQWSDQWSRFYRNWDAGYPSLGLGDCVGMSAVSGKWIQYSCNQMYRFICYYEIKRQTIRLNLSHNGKFNLSDPSLQTAILNEIHKKLKSAGLNYTNISWRKDEGGEMFHLDSKRAVNSSTCDTNLPLEH